jgi:hypothetical protein
VTAPSRLSVARGLVVAALVASALVAGGGAPSAADVPSLTNVGAYGYFASVSLFGGPANTSGPSPTVILPPDGAKPAAPLTTVIPSAKAQFGPATLLDSGEAKVSIDGTPGPNGSVTSTASVTGVADPPLPLLYRKVTSTCTTKGSEVTGSTTLAGDLAVSTYKAPDPRDGDPRDVVPMPANPQPNTERSGELTNVGDQFRVVFNEQIRDGAFLTVNAIHMYLLGPLAKGDLVIAQTRCRAGATLPGDAASTPTSVPASVAPPSPVPAADTSSNAALPLTVGGVVLAAGVAGVALRRRSGNRPPW